MPNFDLNKQADFARATNSFGAGILQTFTGRGDSAWAIEEGSYQSGLDPSKIVLFHVFRTAVPYNAALSRISDSGGRRKAKFQFPYIDGQLTEDMGRTPETFDCDIVIHGDNYLNAFTDLMQILNEPVPGTLIHPIRGKIRCAMETYEVVHSDSQRKAVGLRLTFTEHSIDALVLKKRQDKSAPSLLSKLSSAFAKIESAINAVQGVNFLVQSVKNQIVQSLSDYQNSYAAISGNMNATFNASGNIPALLPVQSGGLQDSSGNIITNAVTLAVSPNDPSQNIPSELLDPQLQTVLAVEQIQKDIQTLRASLGSIIETLSASAEGVGSLEFFDNIIDLRTTANDMQAAFEAGKQSSQVQLIKYVTPRVMSIREVAFENSISPNDGLQIALLNPELESLNYIPQNTELKVAIT